MCLFAISVVSKVGAIHIPYVDNYGVIVLSIIIFLVGFFSPKHGFEGLSNNRGTMEDSTPGLGERKNGILGDGSFGGDGGAGD